MHDPIEITTGVDEPTTFEVNYRKGRRQATWDAPAMDGQFLDSQSPRIRRVSAGVYAAATGAAVIVWMLAGGWRAFAGSDWVAAGVLVIPAVSVWWIVAGVGLRIVRRFDHDGS